jgi:hypothetical protein
MMELPMIMLMYRLTKGDDLSSFKATLLDYFKEESIAEILEDEKLVPLLYSVMLHKKYAAILSPADIESEKINALGIHLLVIGTQPLLKGLLPKELEYLNDLDIRAIRIVENDQIQIPVTLSDPKANYEELIAGTVYEDLKRYVQRQKNKTS